MKKLVYLFALVLFACSTDDPAKQAAAEAEISVMERVVERHNENDTHMKGEYSEHEVEIGVVGDDLVLVHMEDGSPQTFNVVQLRPEDVEELQDMEKGNYEVSDLGTELILRKGDDTYYFSTLENPEHAQLFESSKSFSVIGISNNYVEKEIPTLASGELDFETARRRAQCKCISIYAYERCDAGGEGSNYCSNSACSVGCNQGYYACCNS